MEKAKTASSTSRSSEIRWRRSMPAPVREHRPLCSWQWQLQWRRPSCSRRGSMRKRWVLVLCCGAAGACTQMSTAATTMRATPQAMIRGRVGTWPAPGP